MAASAQDGKAFEVQLLEQLIEMNRRLERLEQTIAKVIHGPEAQRNAPRSVA
jgi:hypothetical protein